MGEDDSHLLLSCGVRVAKLKGEDTSCVEHDPDFPDAPWSLFAVADGHRGPDAAACVRAFLRSTFRARLSLRHSSAVSAKALRGPGIGCTAGTSYSIRSGSSGRRGRPSASALRQALAQSYLALDHSFRATAPRSGCTLTTAVVAGQLLTVANVGDSAAYLDTGRELVQVTTSHRLSDNPGEVSRLRAAGARVARAEPGGARGEPLRPAAGGGGQGPIRLWPGGVSISRAIGDADAGPHQLAHPAVKQLALPATGARLILATDGLWDHVPPGRVAAALRAVAGPQAAADAAVALALAAGKQRDDITVVVVDMLPPRVASFRDVVAQLKANAGQTPEQQRQPSSPQLQAGVAQSPGALAMGPGTSATGMQPQQSISWQRRRRGRFLFCLRRLPTVVEVDPSLACPADSAAGRASSKAPPTPATTEAAGAAARGGSGCSSGSSSDARPRWAALAAVLSGSGSRAAAASETAAAAAGHPKEAAERPPLSLALPSELSVYSTVQAKSVHVIADEDTATWTPHYFTSRSAMGTPQISAVSLSVSALGSPVSSPNASLQSLPHTLLRATASSVGKPSPVRPAREPQPLDALARGDSGDGSMELSHAAAQLVAAVRISDPFLKPVAVPPYAARHEETALVSAFAAAAAVGFDDRAASLASEPGAAEAPQAVAAGPQCLAPQLSASSAGSLSLPRGSAASGGSSSSASRASSGESQGASRRRSCSGCGSQLELGGSATLMTAASRRLSSCLTA